MGQASRDSCSHECPKVSAKPGTLEPGSKEETGQDILVTVLGTTHRLLKAATFRCPIHGPGQVKDFTKHLECSYQTDNNASEY